MAKMILKEKLGIFFVGLGLFVLLGCSAFQDTIIPTYIDPAAIEYADANVPLLLPYTTLTDAKYVDAKLDYIHSLDNLEYAYLKDGLQMHIANAEEFKRVVFNPEGPIGLLLPTLFGGTLGALLIPRPKDKKEIENLKNGKKS